jgi:hypothetical protein
MHTSGRWNPEATQLQVAQPKRAEEGCTHTHTPDGISKISDDK